MSEDKLLHMNDSDICSGPDVTDLLVDMRDNYVDLRLWGENDHTRFFISKKNAALLRDVLNEFLSQSK